MKSQKSWNLLPSLDCLLWFQETKHSCRRIWWISRWMNGRVSRVFARFLLHPMPCLAVTGLNDGIPNFDFRKICRHHKIAIINSSSMLQFSCQLRSYLNYFMTRRHLQFLYWCGLQQEFLVIYIWTDIPWKLELWLLDLHHSLQKILRAPMVAWWRNGYGVGLAIKRSWVRLPVGLLSSYLGLLSLPSFQGR